MKAEKEKVSRLLKTARGQIDGILNMMEEDRYCIDISNQIMATEAILNKVNKEVLNAHIDMCIREAMESGDVDKKLDEIRNIIDKLTKQKSDKMIRSMINGGYDEISTKP